MPIALEEYGFVGISNCAQIWWMKRSGRKSVGSWNTQSG
jgi:hypothetical protein